MKANEIKVGGIYKVRIGDPICDVRVDSINKREGSDYRKGGTSYSCTNLRTNRPVHIKSASKFRSEVKSGSKSDATGSAVAPEYPIRQPVPVPAKKRTPADAVLAAINNDPIIGTQPTAATVPPATKKKEPMTR